MPSRAPTTARGARSPSSSRSSELSAGVIATGTGGPSAERGVAEEARLLAEVLAGGSPVVISCVPTAEGVLSAVGLTYLAHADPRLVRLCPEGRCQPRIGETPFSATCDANLAVRVYDGFGHRVAGGCGRARSGRCPGGCREACARKVVYACAADDPSMPEAVHRYLRLGFSVGTRVGAMLAHPDVAALSDLARATGNECERTRQFVRFSHMADGSFMATFRPGADTVPLVAGYFAARMGTERFCLVDPAHRVAAFHDGGLAVVRLDEGSVRELADRKALATDERYVRAMWKRFYDGLELQGRDPSQRGYDLRRQFMPKRLWAHLPEVDPRSADAGHFVPPAYRGGDGRGTLPTEAGSLETHAGTGAGPEG